MTDRLQQLRAPLVNDRVRAIRGQSFVFLPHRFLRDGFLTAITGDELALYVFLLLAGNRHGVSFYGVDAICAILRLPLERYIHARNALVAKDLLAVDGIRFQVLSLPDRPLDVSPARPLETPQDFEDHDPATIRDILLEDLGTKRHR